MAFYNKSNTSFPKVLFWQVYFTALGSYLWHISHISGETRLEEILAPGLREKQTIKACGKDILHCQLLAYI